MSSTKTLKQGNNSSAKEFFKNLGDKFLMGAGKLGNQRHLAALRDAFALFTPLIIAGSFAVVFRTSVFGAAGGAMTSLLGGLAKLAGETTWVAQHQEQGKVVAASLSFVPGSSWEAASTIGNFAFYTVERATFGLITVYFSFGVGYFIARSRNDKTPVIAGLVTLAVVVSLNGSLWWGAPKYLDAEGLMTAILFGIPSAEIFCLLSKSQKLLIKMPAGVPPAVARSFAKLFPILILLIGVAGLQAMFMSVGYSMKTLTTEAKVGHMGGYTFTVGDAIFHGIQAPFLKVVSNSNADLGIGLTYALLISLLWFFGVHGANVMNGIFGVVYITLLTENINGANHVFVQGTWDAFIFLGGTGATMGLIIAIFLFSKRKASKEIAKFSVPAGIFQINEPIIFGTPIVVNPVMGIPFIICTPILVIITYLAIHVLGWVPKVVVWIPWTTPAPFGGLLATGMRWQGIILALFNLVVATFIYIPFVFVANKVAKKNGEELYVSLVKFGKRTPEEKQMIADHKTQKLKTKKEKKAAKEAKKFSHKGDK